jgi:hypothetical protein
MLTLWSSQLALQQLNQLADELRSETIFSVSKTGGHLGSSLGVVELTVALHHVFNAPEDRILWDVGHQASVDFCHFEQKYACVCVTRCKTVFSLQCFFGLVINCVSFCLCTDLSTQDPHRQKVQDAYSSADCWPFRFHKAFREWIRSIWSWSQLHNHFSWARYPSIIKLFVE